MHATEFLKSIPEEPAPVIVLVGDERSLKTDVTNALLKVALPNEDDSPTRYTGKDVDICCQKSSATKLCLMSSPQQQRF